MRLVRFKPRDHAGMAVAFGRLAEHVGIEQPLHSLSFFGISRLRGGRSSIGTGHDLSTSS